MQRYVSPRIGSGSEVDSADLLDILTPTWYVTAEKTRAVRQRIGSVPEWAIAKDMRNDNPRDREPLCRCAIEILDTMGALADGVVLVFPMRIGRSVARSKMLQHDTIAAVAHAFRSSFRDWAEEETGLPRGLIEAALAQTVQWKVEAAYARSDLSERQWRLMEDWLGYLASKAGDAPSEDTIM